MTGGKLHRSIPVQGSESQHRALIVVTPQIILRSQIKLRLLEAEGAQRVR